MVKKKQKLHREKGLGPVIIGLDLFPRIDALRLTPKDSRHSVIRRAIELAESVNTKEAPPKVSTPQKGRRKKITGKRRKGAADA